MKTEQDLFPTDSDSPSMPPALSAKQLRRRWLALGLGSLSLLAATGQASWASHAAAATPATTKDPLWVIQLPAPEGTELRLSEYVGQPLIINFWATWCAPCVEELPLLNAFHAKDNGWTTIGIAVDTPANVQRFVQRFALSFPIGIAGAAGVGLAKELGNTGGLPYTLVVDRKGMIRDRKVGQIHATDLANWELLA